MSVFKRGKTYWYKFKFAGQEIRESAKTTSKTLAKEAERARRRAMEGAYNNVQKRPTPTLFSVAARTWLQTHPEWRSKTIEMQRGCLKHLAPRFDKLLISDITADDIARYQNARLREMAAPRTVNIEVGTLRSILIKNRLWGAISPDVRMLKEPQSCGRALSPAEQDKLLAECCASRNKALYPIVETALATGLRSGEIRKLHWAQVTATIITVGHSKTAQGEHRVVPINSRLRKILDLWAQRVPARKPQHFVFPFELSAGGGIEGKFGFVAQTSYQTDPTRPIGSWKKSFTAACKRAGLKIRFHDLRHTAVTRMLEAGIPLEHVARICGWSPSTMAEMSRRYGHLSTTALTAAVESLAQENTVEGVQLWAQNSAALPTRIQ